MPVTYHVNGDLVPADEATVSVRDRGFRYGDGAFETLRVYGGFVFEWAAHADRLLNSCDALGIEPPPRGDLRDRVRETVAANALDEGAVRLSVTRGAGGGRLTPPARGGRDPTVVVTAAELPPGGPRGDVWKGPATAALTDVRAIPDASIPADAKTHNYLDGVLARRVAARADADAALLRSGDGAIAEGAAANLFLVRDGTVHTPALDGPVLPGVTRRIVVECARERGVPVETGTYRPADLRGADEAFLTNTTWEVRPVGRLVEPPDGDGTAVGGGPVTDRLRSAFGEHVERSCRVGDR
jgi:branched-chain amino acid aminotransferase